MEMALKQKILCFGASLVEGYVFSREGIIFSPFTLTLSQQLSAAGYDSMIDNRGMSGQTTSEMVPRFYQTVHNGGYTHAIILGGTNDLGDREPDITSRNLIKMYNFAKLKGIIPMAVTLPELEIEISEKWVTFVRLAVNNSIKEFCTSNNIPVLDLAKLIPHNSLSTQEKHKIWSDGIHLSRHGYELFGEYAFEALVKLLPPPPLPPPSKIDSSS